jgi:glycogen debranching enzyme
MFESFLVPEKTVVTAKGDGPPIDVSAVAGRVLLAVLRITRVVEQEALDVSVLASKDGAAWDPKPVASFPQKFYAGEHPLLVDLTGDAEVRFLRAHWEVNRWGRGSEVPMFEFQVKLKEVPADLLQAAMREAESRR